MKFPGLLLCLVVAAACADNEEQCPAAQERSGSAPLPAEIDAILEQHCRECHGDPPTMFAPLPLVDWEDVQAPRHGEPGDEPVYRAIERRIADEVAPMPPVTRPQLDREERMTLEAWIADCAPPAEP